MLKALLFLTVAMFLCLVAVTRGGACWAVLWPAANFAWIGIAYLARNAAVFGKRPDGTLAPGIMLWLSPFLGYQWSIWAILRLVLRAPACQQLLPDVWVGRRLLPHELPAGIERILDLTAEFPEPAGVRDQRQYFSCPILDATAPSASRLHEWLHEIECRPAHLLIHCAQGHGRTGLAAAALLLKRGHARNPADAIARVQAVRRGVRLNRDQRRCLSDVARLLASTTAAAGR